MLRNRLILACAAILSFGMWMAWRSIPKVEAQAPIADLAPFSSSRGPDAGSVAESPPAPAPSLERSIPELASDRAPAVVEPKAEAQSPLVVAGIVVDDHGAPVESADVYVISEGTAESAKFKGRAPRPWTSTNSDSSGRFEIRDLQDGQHLFASASKAGYFDVEHVPFERGATEMKLVLRRGGVVAGRVLVDPRIPMDLLRIRLEGSGERPDAGAIGRLPLRPPLRSNGEGDPLQRKPSADGAFVFEGLATTTAKISVTVQDCRSSVLEVDAIRVREIGDPVDPRLDPLDLRGALELLAIDVLDDAGRKCSGATVVLGDPLGRFTDRGQVTQDGRATFLTPTGAFDVDVDRTGWRRVHLTGVRNNQVVQLKKGSPVRVILDGPGGLPTEPYRLIVALLADVQQPRSVVDGMGAFSGGREATFLASSPGLHEVAWYLESGTRQSFLIGTPRRTVELRDSDEEQVIHLDLAEALRESWEATIHRLESETARLQAKVDGFR